MPITDCDLDRNTARGFCESWSVMARRRSSSSTALDAIGLGDPTAAMIRRNGTPMKKIIIPATTPARVSRNCFMGVRLEGGASVPRPGPRSK